MTFKQTVRFAFVALVSLFHPACVKTPALKEPEVVSHVDLSRYVGKWYDIGHLPFRYQRNCYGTTATYAARLDGKISVVNQCRKGSLEGKENRADGIAKVVDPVTNAKLKVSFFGPFYGDYWILELDPEYRWAVVGTPNYKYLWILSRTPALPEGVFAPLVKRFGDKGFDVTRLEITQQRLD